MFDFQIDETQSFFLYGIIQLSDIEDVWEDESIFQYHSPTKENFFRGNEFIQ